MAQNQRATPTQNPTANQNHSQQTFLEHLSELRVRLFVVACVLAGGTGLGFLVHDQIARILLAPLAGEKLIYLTPGGGFDFMFRTALCFGITLSIPVIIYEFYRYLAPAMKHQQTRRFIAFIIIMASILAATGVCFGYFFILPAALHFLMHLGDGFVQANLTASGYLDFVTVHSFGFAAIFELPILLLIINETGGPLNPRQLLRSERYVIPAAFLLAAMFAPTPDMLSQLTVALPIVFIYQIGVAIVLAKNHSHRKVSLQSESVRLTSTPQTPLLLAVEPVVQAPVVLVPVSVQRQVCPALRQRIAMDIMPIAQPRPALRATPRPVLRPQSGRRMIDDFFVPKHRNNRLTTRPDPA